MDPAALELIASRIRTVPDFPKPGILFRDITPLLADPLARAQVTSLMAQSVAPWMDDLDAVVGIESRGFLFGLPLADFLGVSFVPLRKPGKLPAATRSASYDLEYGQAALEIHADALRPGSKVIVIDDVLATGGTAAAAVALVTLLGAQVVGVGFLLELVGLRGRTKLANVPVISILEY